MFDLISYSVGSKLFLLWTSVVCSVDIMSETLATSFKTEDDSEEARTLEFLKREQMTLQEAIAATAGETKNTYPRCK